MAEKALFPSLAAKKSQRRLGSSFGGHGRQPSESVNLWAGGRAGAELQCDTKVTNSPQVLSQLHTLEPPWTLEPPKGF